jgi:hypothetical protein
MLTTKVRPYIAQTSLYGIGEKQDLPQEGKGSTLGGWAREMCERHLGILMSLAYFAIGFSPITALAIAIMGWLPLGTTTLLFVLPSTAVGIGLALRFPYYGKLALKGLLIGLVAVFLYDCMRVPFILSGAWGDFIPHINMWLFNTDEPNWVVGYVWRYVGDGGFMGMAFTVAYCVLKPQQVSLRVATVGFGVGIWICLVLTLLLAPHGQEMLFKLTPTTITLSLLGHLIYGFSIGMLLPYVKELKATEEPQVLSSSPQLRVYEVSGTRSYT